MGKYYSTKTYGNDRGLSCCFRQRLATHSHCSLLHGYSIGVRIVFECDSLDERNWVMDFGGLKEFEKYLKLMFDHTVLVAEDDIELVMLMRSAEALKMVALRVVPAVGCEKFAEMIYTRLDNMFTTDTDWKGDLKNKTVRVKSVEVFEHGANSAIYER